MVLSNHFVLLTGFLVVSHENWRIIPCCFGGIKRQFLVLSPHFHRKDEISTERLEIVAEYIDSFLLSNENRNCYGTSGNRKQLENSNHPVKEKSATTDFQWVGIQVPKEFSDGNQRAESALAAGRNTKGRDAETEKAVEGRDLLSRAGSSLSDESAALNIFFPQFCA